MKNNCKLENCRVCEYELLSKVDRHNSYLSGFLTALLICLPIMIFLFLMWQLLANLN